MNKMTYSIEQIKKMNENEWQEFRKTRWSQKRETYNDKENIPDWFWPSQKEKGNTIRKRAWAKKCTAYSQSLIPQEWFMPSKEKYIDFLEKLEARRTRKTNNDSGKIV